MHQPNAGAPVDRDDLIRRHLPLVRRVARRHAGRLPAGVDFDDLLSWGCLGLLAAVERYEPSRAALFPAYARFRIRGAILDQLRGQDWMPRSVRDKAAAVARAARDAERRLGRPATEEELATALGMPLATYRAMLEEVAPVALIGLEDLEADLPDDRRGDGQGQDPLDALLARERLRLLTDAVRRLPQREQLVLSLYYRDELTMKEVGAVLGVTESRVSQLRTQALLRVRGLLRLLPAGGQARGVLKVRRQTADQQSGGSWERTGSETPHGRCACAGAGGCSGSASACEAGATHSTRMRRRGRCSTRSAAPGRSEAAARSGVPGEAAGG